MNSSLESQLLVMVTDLSTRFGKIESWIENEESSRAAKAHDVESKRAAKFALASNLIACSAVIFSVVTWFLRK